MPSITVYTSGDGTVWQGSGGSAFGNLRAGPGNESDTSSVTLVVGIISTGTSSLYSELFRAILQFDTSSIPDGATVTAATLYVWGFDKDNGLGNGGLYLVGANPTGVISDADYDSLGGTAYGVQSYSGFNSGGYNAIDLNSAGLLAIDKNGTTSLGLRVAYDYDNNSPTWRASEETIYLLASFNNAGFSEDPKLVITYTYNPPSVSTQAVSSIANTTATGNGNITLTDVGPADLRGIVYDTDSSGAPGNVAPASSGYALKVEESGSFSTGAFTESLTGLTPNTTYYARAYAHNSAGYGYGSQVSFTTTALVPTATTQAVTAIDKTTATGNGNITSDGGATITERGVCWSTSANPTTADSKATSAGTTGAFTAGLTGLSSGTLYHVRAYAINSVGTSYGADVTFTTSGFTSPTNAYSIDGTFATTLADTGDIAVYLSGDGGATYTTPLYQTFDGTNTLKTYGNGAEELWGAAWLGSMTTDANFRVKVVAGTALGGQVYRDFSSPISGSQLLTGITIEIKAKWDGTTTSVDYVGAEFHYGTSSTPVQPGSVAFASDGGPDDTGALAVYDGTEWLELGNSTQPSATTTVEGIIELATNAEVATGTDTDRAVVPSSLYAMLATGWLEAGETWTYASGSGTNVGTFTASGDLTTKYYAGMKGKFTQTTVKHFILTKVAHAAGTTTFTAYFGTDYTIANAAISANYFSMMRTPSGFPMEPEKWSESFSDGTSTAIPNTTTAQIGAYQLTFPIGSWNFYGRALIAQFHNGNNPDTVTQVAFSTSTSSFSDNQLLFTQRSLGVTGLTGNINADHIVSKLITVTSATIYYYVGEDNTLSALVRSDVGAFTMRATSAYL